MRLVLLSLFALAGPTANARAEGPDRPPASQPSEPLPLNLKQMPYDGSYAERLILAIKKNIVLTESVPGNPEALVEVDAALDGSIKNVKLVRSSGHSTWDRAVLMALARTERLPLDSAGRVPPRLQISFRPQDPGR